MTVDQILAKLPDELREITSVHNNGRYTEIALTIEGWGVVEFDCYVGGRVYTYATFESSEPFRMQKAIDMAVEIATRAKKHDDDLWSNSHYSENL